MQIHTEPHNTSYFREGLWWKIALSAIVFLGLGTLSGLSTMSDIQGWYAELEKPFFTPPNWLFGPAWTILYILMGGSFGLIWQVAAKGRYPIIIKFAKRGLVLFAIHFVLNLLWTPVFFGLHNPAWGLVVIVLILSFIIILIRHFFRLDRLASFLLIPYLIWVSYATALNAAILILN
jgi:tryptophan-rich sensory protein